MCCSKILCALQWLKQNNRYYQDITVDESALAQLLEDGDLSELTTITLPVDDDDHIINNPCDGDGDTFMSGTFVPMAPKNNNEQQVMRQSIADRQHADEANKTIEWLLFCFEHRNEVACTPGRQHLCASAHLRCAAYS